MGVERGSLDPRLHPPAFAHEQQPLRGKGSFFMGAHVLTPRPQPAAVFGNVEKSVSRAQRHLFRLLECGKNGHAFDEIQKRSSKPAVSSWMRRNTRIRMDLLLAMCKRSTMVCAVYTSTHGIISVLLSPRPQKLCQALVYALYGLVVRVL